MEAVPISFHYGMAGYKQLPHFYGLQQSLSALCQMQFSAVAQPHVSNPFPNPGLLSIPYVGHAKSSEQTCDDSECFRLEVANLICNSVLLTK